MFAESIQADKVKTELRGLESNQHIESILNFLEKYIPTFTKEFNQKENESFEFWCEQINSWIDELIDVQENQLWNKFDKIIKEYEKMEIAKYKSKNKRSDGSSIILIHFWIKKN